MPVEIFNTDDGAVALVRCYGNLTEADLRASVEHAFSQRLVKPHQDRIVMIDQDAGMGELDTKALKNIQQQVLEEETRDGSGARFRSVLVYSAPLQEDLLKLYRALWNDLNLPGVEFFVVDRKDVAMEILADPARVVSFAAELDREMGDRLREVGSK